MTERPRWRVSERLRRAMVGMIAMDLIVSLLVLAAIFHVL